MLLNPPPEIIIPTDLPSATTLFIDPRTRIPLRWMIQVEVMDHLPLPGRVYVWRSDAPRRLFAYPDVNAPAPAQIADNFRGINPATGLPNAFELRDYVTSHAGIY